MIQFQFFSSDADRVIQDFAEAAPRIEIALRRQLMAEIVDLANYSAENKLSGQLLQSRSGRLRRSLLASPEVDSVSGMVTGSIGTDSSVPYGAIHEFGFDGSENVREYLRRTKAGRMAAVRSHTRQMHMPERLYLRSALEERMQQLVANLQQALSEAVQQL